MFDEKALSNPQLNSNVESNEESRDLGFGSVVARESRERLLNPDGSFNVARKGLNIWTSLSPYQSLLTMPWWEFISIVVAFYLLMNTLFAFAYMLCGPEALAGPHIETPHNDFLRAFFFSVQTFATIGYGHISPVTLAANIIVTIESLFGLLGFALATGLLFARFSRPTAKLLFSRNAVIAPYRGITAFEFRITNARSNQLIELEAKVLFARFETVDGKPIRRFDPLTLERSKVAFFPLSWTIVHPIDESSPLYTYTDEKLRAKDGEFLVLFTGIDETFSQTVHARSSYKADEVIWHSKFSNIYNPLTDNSQLTIDVRRLSDIDKIKY